jgi:hypothetical protein
MFVISLGCTTPEAATSATMSPVSAATSAEGPVPGAPEPVNVTFIEPAPPEHVLSLIPATSSITYTVDVPVTPETLRMQNGAIVMNIANLWRVAALSHSPILAWDAIDWFGPGCDESCVDAVVARAASTGGVMRGKLIVTSKILGIQRPDTTPTECANIVEEEVTLDLRDATHDLAPDPEEPFFDSFLSLGGIEGPVRLDIGTIPCH